MLNSAASWLGTHHRHSHDLFHLQSTSCICCLFAFVWLKNLCLSRAESRWQLHNFPLLGCPEQPCSTLSGAQGSGLPWNLWCEVVKVFPVNSPVCWVPLFVSVTCKWKNLNWSDSRAGRKQSIPSLLLRWENQGPEPGEASGPAPHRGQTGYSLLDSLLCIVHSVISENHSRAMRSQHLQQ